MVRAAHLGSKLAPQQASALHQPALLGSGACLKAQPRFGRFAHAGPLGHQEGCRCAHVLRRSRDLIEVIGSAISAFAAARHRPALTGRDRGLSSTCILRLARLPAKAAVAGLVLHGRRRSLVLGRPARSTPAMPPNMSLNRSRYGMPPWPRGAVFKSSASRPGRHASASRLALR